MGKTKRGDFSRLGRILAGILCAVMTLCIVGEPVLTARASSIDDKITYLQDQYKKQQQENENRKKQIEALGGDISSNKEAMKLADEYLEGVKAEIALREEYIGEKLNQIANKRAEIEAVEQSIADKEDEIEQRKVEIAELQAENKENLRKFAKLARALYMNDTSGTIPVLNGSDDWYSYFVYSDVVRNISGQNAEFMQRLMDSIKAQETLIDAMNAEIERLEQNKLELEAQKAEYEKEETALEAEKAELTNDAADASAYLNNLAQQNSNLQSRVDKLTADNAEGDDILEELDRQIESLIRQKQSGSDTVQYTDGLIWPLEKKFQLITTYFVAYSAFHGGAHKGIDIGNAGIKDAEIHAAQSGTVIVVSNTCTHNYGKQEKHYCGGGYGNYIIIDHGGQLSTLYAHCGSINVTQGQFVNQGDVIGHVGSTGWSTGYHLHFETRVNGIAQNPFNYTYKYIF